MARQFAKKVDITSVEEKPMSEYLIWASEKLSENTGVDVSLCMDILMNTNLTKDSKYSVQEYKKEEKNGNRA